MSPTRSKPESFFFNCLHTGPTSEVFRACYKWKHRYFALSKTVNSEGINVYVQHCHLTVLEISRPNRITEFRPFLLRKK